MLNNFIVDEIIKKALIEDIHYVDITTDNLIDEECKSYAYILAKEEGVLCGIQIAKRVFEIIDEKVEFHVLHNDSDHIKKGDIIAKLYGSTRSLLKGERLALNILQRLSGIATKTNKIVNLVKDYKVRIVDTRKTTPNLRALEKYAVKVGGGYNHRYNLSESVMIKDNHIKAVGSITMAVDKIKSKIGHTIKVEIEVKNIDEFKEAISTDVDIIMLDNMNIEDIKECVKLNKRRCVLEVSGNITEDTVLNVAKTGIDVISIGELTHSVKSLDISMKIE
ncbi:nicotinate-nucleotide pyrophosphorylase [carboxylating] [Alkalithermobacter thermoalcaliphilus JW-YL-7 = DSM 7308]|uniref:Probable nicotinate-nucleotide pyrophosphorylase [carboxylating] n=1 Tax=Alkalithermobacter thermoalcaliphilus JW-YL-7 = DSM 7308 TaxID=1121328 RepID=A0A150FT27_CLOPD|nr:nicotinate-nucleotide pyrophosphorylase [[Clostridium] paradoxum JW-YL-7 = DSM 7308]SHL28750.1 nicotinate-nucleotide pyrophosphorylase [carboxylating] [[Clostridium] paradoxum JW-YL-7 = DSM 7308]